MCATYHCFFHSLISFNSVFSSKEGAPLHACISKFLFSIPRRNQDLFSDQLLGQFPQNSVSFSSCVGSRKFLFHHLGVSTDQYNRGALLAADRLLYIMPAFFRALEKGKSIEHYSGILVAFSRKIILFPQNTEIKLFFMRS